MKPRITTIDYETEGIKRRPIYPPVPTGVGIHETGKPPVYLSWKHPSKNNNTKSKAQRILRAIYRDPMQTMLFHNAAFDLDVGMVHMGLPLPPEHRFRDTLIEAFLCYPDHKDISLKPMAEHFCQIKPVERDHLKEWVLANVKGAKDAKKGEKAWGSSIYLAPGDLVGRYCISDLRMTLQLHKFFSKQLIEANMLSAYVRERKAVLYTLQMSTQGIPIRRQALTKNVKQWENNLEILDDCIRKRVNTPNLDVDKKRDFADALEKAGMVDAWVYTKPTKRFPEGQRSTNKENLAEVIKDPLILNMMAYRGKLTVALRTFASTWLEQAEQAQQDRIYCSWNTVRGDRGDGQVGARTGRCSSSPNVQNISKVPDVVVYTMSDFRRLRKKGVAALLLPRSLGKYADTFMLPNLRSYVGGSGWWLTNRDYMQQELRILAHFESGVLMRAYNDDPMLDMHDLARKLINRLIGAKYSRDKMKTTGFGIIYGIGNGKLAKQLGEDTDAAKRSKSAYLEIFPGVQTLIDDLKARSKEGAPFYTWGGRRYFCEPPTVIDGRLQTYEYKTINTLIQGSAGDQTKEAMVRFAEYGLEPLWLQVHDETLGGHRSRAEAEHYNRCLTTAMESTEFDVPMLTSGGVKRRWTK